MSGDPEVQGTAEFVGMFDKFFDILNVTNAKRKRKAFQAPYRSPADFRLKVLYMYMYNACVCVHVHVTAWSA